MPMTPAPVDLDSLRTVLARYDELASYAQRVEAAPSSDLEQMAHAFAIVLRETVTRTDAAASATAALVAQVEAAGIEAANLDGLVHDLASNPASAINNDGVEAQVAYLVEQLGADQARAAIAKETGQTLPDPSRIVHVVNWTPQGVGGFEWRRNAAQAAEVVRDLEDETARVHVVELPAEVADAGPAAITEWLDDEGWSDGGDPRQVGSN